MADERETVDVDGQRYEIVITAEAEVIPGPDPTEPED